MANCPAPGARRDGLSSTPTAPARCPTAVYTHLRYDVGALTADPDRATSASSPPSRCARTRSTGTARPPATARPRRAPTRARTSTTTAAPRPATSRACRSTRVPPATTTARSPVSDTDTIVRTAEDLRILKSASSDVISQGAITTWTLHVDASRVPLRRRRDRRRHAARRPVPARRRDLREQRRVRRRPDLRPVAPIRDGANRERERHLEPRVGAAEPPRSARSRYTITFKSRTRAYYQENGSRPDAGLRPRLLDRTTSPPTGQDFRICDAATTTAPAPAPRSTATRSTARQTPTSPRRASPPAARRSTSACRTPPLRARTARPAATRDTPPSAFAPGDKVCYRLRVDVPSDLDFRQHAGDRLRAGRDDVHRRARPSSPRPAPSRRRSTRRTRRRSGSTSPPATSTRSPARSSRPCSPCGSTRPPRSAAATSPRT